MPNDYCQTNPKLITTCYINGDNNTTAPVDAMVSWNYNDSGTTTTNERTLANKAQIGSAWGVAYSKTRKRVYTASFLKRHVGVGPGGLGAIYVADPATATSASLFITIPNAGTIASNASRGLGAPSVINADPTTFSLVGAIGLGDLDISDDEQYLYVTNLNDKKIYIINIDTQSIVTSISVPDPGCTGGDYRPFGLAYRNGNLYAGITCDASTSNSRNDLKAFVYVMDGANNTFSAAPVLQTNLNYRRTPAWNEPSYGSNGQTDVLEHSRYWYPWVSTYDQTTLGGVRPSFSTNTDWISHPTPLLSDIVFDEDGSMIVGFIDRTSHQVGTQSYQPTGNASNNIQENNISGGDILRATSSGSSWSMEPLNYTISGTPLEFYSGEVYQTAHYETAQGGLALVKGKGEVVTIAMDPLAAWTGGIIKLSNTTGLQTSNFQIFGGIGGNVPFFGKATGLGDLEVLCDVAPIEIGNRIWQDYDRDGIQDPNEPGISNVVVSLYKSSTLIASATTNANGGYYFSSASGTNTTSAIYNLTALTPGASVQLRTSLTQTALASFSLTAADQGTNDAIDSDFAPSGVGSTTAVANVPLGATGQNDHTFDAGLYACPTITFTSPAASSTYCANSTATFTVSTNAIAPDGIKLVAFTTATDPYSTTAGAVFSTSVASSTVTGTKTFTFDNIQLPDNLTEVNLGLFVYAVLISADGTCQPLDSRIVTLTPRPVPVIGGPTQVCTGSKATLSAVAYKGATYQWYYGSSGTTLLDNTNPYTTTAITTTTTYRVRAYNIVSGNVCYSDYTSFTVTPIQCTACAATPTSLGGTTFRDFNSDGTKGTEDLILSDITVTLFRCDATNQSTQVATMQTDLNGAYSFTGLTAGTTYRVEFSNLPAGYQSTYRGTNNGTTVQFTQPGSCTTSIGLNLATDFCQTNPLLVTPCYLDGAVMPNTTAGNDVLVGVSYNYANGPYHLGTRTQIGSTWGVAYAGTTKKLYTAAFLKRHVGLKDGALGQIFITDMTNPNSASTTTTPWLNVSALVSGNWQFATDAGRGLGNAGTQSIDAQSFSLIAGIGLGDIDISEDEKTLYVMDLTNKQLLAIDIATKTLKGQYPVPSLCSTASSTSYFSAGSGNSLFTANDGKQWQLGYAFDIYSSSTNYNQTITNPNSAAAGTSDQTLYANSAAVAPGKTMTYSFPVGNGTFGVKLHMATSTTANNRNTTVALESTTVLSGFDVYAAAGNQINVGLTRSFTTTLTDGVLNIAITANPGSGSAMVSGFELTTLNGTPTGETRPFGLGVYNGKVYVGAVCDASHSQNRADLQASVLEFNPVTGSYSPTPVLSFPLNYTKKLILGGDCFDPSQWHPWTSIYPNGTASSVLCGGAGPSMYLQPTLSDIVFDVDGSMILGFFSRHQHQQGALTNYTPDHTAANGRLEVASYTSGELLRAYFNGSSYEIEYNGKEGPHSPKPATGGKNNNGGIGGGEFYVQTSFGAFESTMGGLAFKPGSGEIRMTASDPATHDSGGLIGVDNTIGTTQNAFTLYLGATGGAQFKSAGLGDLEVLCDPSPIQIGNRVWRDDNANGIQDPCEPPIPGAVVTLYDATKTTVYASVTTSAAGEYYFSSTTLTAGNSTSSVATTALTYNTGYAVVLTSLGTSTVVTGLSLTNVSPVTPSESGTANSGSTQVNNDAILVNGKPCIGVTTGEPGSNNHTYDFGITIPDCAKPELAVSKSQTICQGGSFSLPLSATITSNTVTSGLQWYLTDASGSSFTAISGATSLTFSPTSAQLPTATGGVRYYAIMGQNGLSAFCADTAFVTLKIDPIVTVAFNSPAANTQYCGNSTATFTVTTNATAPAGIKLLAFTTATDPYSTTAGAVFSTSVVSSTVAGAKTLTFSNVQLPDNLTGANMDLFVYAVLVSPTTSACPSPLGSSLTITLKPRPNTVIGGPQQVCTGSTAILLADTYNFKATYQWFIGNSTVVVGGSYLNTTTAINATTTYRVRLTLDGCMSDDASFTVTPVPCTPCTASATSLGGKVYRDFDSDGTADANDLTMSGITVMLFRCDATNQSSQVATMQTDLNGAYSFTGLTAGSTYRVEFSNLPSGYMPTYRGQNNGTMVQFTQPGSCTTNLGINQPIDYCQANPFMVIPCYLNGTSNSNADALVKFVYNNAGTSPKPTELAHASEVASVWGVAYSRQTKQLYTATFLKRHVGLRDINNDGKGDLGLIWQTSNPNATTSINTVWADLTAAPYNLDLGTIGNDASRGLGASGQPNNDPAAFPLVGKVGLGDIDISDDNSALWVVNPKQNQLHKIAINADGSAGSMTTFNLPNACSNAFDTLYVQAGGTDFSRVNGGFAGDNFYVGGSPTTTGQPGVPYTRARSGTSFSYRVPLPNGTYNVQLYVGTQVSLNQSFTVAGTVQSFTAMANSRRSVLVSNAVVTNGLLDIVVEGNAGNSAYLSGIKIWSATGNKLADRSYPFALKYRNGKVYVGTTCPAEVSQDFDHLSSTVYELVDNGSTTFTPVLTLPLNYAKGATSGASCNGNRWHPWLPVMPGTCTYIFSYEEPVLSDIEFDVDGSMILGYFDRFTHQIGNANYPPTGTNLIYSASGGDILRACYVNGVFQQPGSPTCPNNAFNNQGPGGGEFYPGDVAADFAQEATQGGLTLLPGRNEVATNGYDVEGVRDGGVYWFNNSTGAKSRTYEVYPDAGNATGNFAKGTGLGDLEVLCDLAPIQIGNRVWRDDNANGIQDPCEPPIPGAVVRLYDAAKTTILASATTNAAGEYYFQSATVVAGTSTSAVTTTALTYNTTYGLVISSLGTSTVVTSQALALTDVSPVTPGESNTANSGTTQINNDAKVDVVGGVSLPCIKLTTGGPGETNHTYDFGIVKNTCVLPSVTALASATTLCQGNNMTAIANVSPAGSYTYSWAAPQGVVLNSTNSATVTASNLNTGINTFTVTVSSSPVCLTTTTVSVTVTALPVATVVSQTICAGQPAVLTVQNCAGSVLWSANANNAAMQSVTVSPTSTTTYSVSCIANGCVGSATATVTVLPQPVINTVSPGSCVGTSHSFTVNANLSPNTGTLEYSFNGGISFQQSNSTTITANSPTTVNIVVRTVGTSCTAMTTYTINCACQNPATVNMLPASIQSCGTRPVSLTASVGGGATSATLTSSGTGTFSQSVLTGATIISYQPSAGDVTAGNVTLTLTSADPDGSGSCQPVQLVRVLTINPLPGVSATSASLCAGGVATLQASGAGTYLWSNGATTAGISVSVAGTYSVTGLSAQGCSNVASGTLTVYPAPTISPAGLPTGVIGVAYSQTVTGSGGTAPYSFTLSGGSLPAGLNLSSSGVLSGTPVSNAPSTFTVLMTDAKGCTAVQPYSSTLVTASLGDYVFEDVNANGIQDAGDKPVSGVVVTLLTNNTPLTGTITNAGGFYSFTGLTPGVPYSVSFTPPPGFSATTANTGSDDSKDSDGNPATGLTGVYTLTVNENNPTVDMGYYKPASLGDYVWVDANRNGIQDVGESPIPGVTVVLYVNGVASATTTTNASGLYSFTGLTPGSSLSYSVGFTVPVGYTTTTANAPGSMTANDSDASQVTGRSPSVTLASGENNPTLDAGYYLLDVPTILSATVCAGVPASLTLLGCTGSIQWTGPFISSGATSSVVTISTSAAAGVQQIISYTATCANVQAPLTGTVTINPAVTAAISPMNSSVCAGQSTALTASGGATYRWNTGAVTTSISVSMAGPYTVTATSAAGCSATAMTTVSVNPLPVLTISSATICAGQTATLVAGGASSYQWSNGANTAINQVSPTVTTVYTVTGISSVGCSSVASNTVVVNGRPQINSITQSTACVNNVAGLTVNVTNMGAGTLEYSLNGGAFQPSNSFTISAVMSTTASVVVRTMGSSCTATESVVVNCACQTPVSLTFVPAVLQTCAGMPVSITAGVGGATSATLTGSGTGTFSQNMLANTGVQVMTYTPSVADATAGSVTLTLTSADPDGSGSCVAEQVMRIVTINALPVVSATSASICAGGVAVLVASGASTYQWSNGATTASISVSVAGTYSVTGLSAQSCSNMAGGTLTVYPAPTLSLRRQLVANTNKAILTATGCVGGTINWSTGATGTSVITLTLTGTNPVYSATCVTAGGCSVTAAIPFNTSPGGDDALRVNDALVCVGNTASLTATGCINGTLLWSTNATSVSIQVPGQTASYTVTCTDSKGKLVAVGSVSAVSAPVLTLTALPSAIPTVGSSTTLTVSGCQSGTVNWSTGQMGGSNLVVSTTAVGTTLYSVTCVMAGGCSSSAGLSLSSTLAPEPKVMLAKQVSKNRAKPGEVVSYTVSLTNTGTAPATAVVVSDTYTTGLSVVAGSVTVSTGSYTPGANGGQWALASLPVGATATLTYSASMTASGVIYNTARLPDQAVTVCTTVPVQVCQGEQIAVLLSAPAGYSRYQWYLTPVGGTTQTLVSDGTQNSFTATVAGEYRLVTESGTGKACIEGSCCPLVIEEVAVPSYTALVGSPGCVGNVPQANGQITLLNLGNDPTSYVYQVSRGTTFNTAEVLGTAEPVPSNGMVARGLLPGNYTVRVWLLIDGVASCPRDLTVAVVENCACPAAVCQPIIIRKTKSLSKTMP